MMGLLKSILDFYIRSSLHVAVCFVALMKVYHYYTFIVLDIEILIIAFCFVIIGYNFIKYASIVLKKRDFRFKNGIITITVLAAITSLYLLLFENVNTYIIIVCAGLLSLFYVIPIYHKKSLRLISIIKVITVVAVWFLVIVVTPVYSEYANVFQLNCFGFASPILLNWVPYFIKSIGLFLFIFCLCIPFEIRDLKYDDLSLKTIPQIIGVKKTKYLGVIFLFISFSIHHYYIHYESFYYFIPVFIIGFTGILIWFSDKFKSDYYASFFVEAVPLLWLGLFYLFN